MWGFWNHSCPVHLSYLRPASWFSWFLTCPRAPQHWGWGWVGGGICWIADIVFCFGSPHSHLEAPKRWWLWHACLLMWQEMFLSQSLSMVGNSTICERLFMTFFFLVRLLWKDVWDQTKVLVDTSLQVLTSGLGPLIDNRRFSGSSIF